MRRFDFPPCSLSLYNERFATFEFAFVCIFAFVFYCKKQSLIGNRKNLKWLRTSIESLTEKKAQKKQIHVNSILSNVFYCIKVKYISIARFMKRRRQRPWCGCRKPRSMGRGRTYTFVSRSRVKSANRLRRPPITSTGRNSHT